MVEIIKPEKGQKGWAEILNDALDTLEELSTAGGKWHFVPTFSPPNNESDNLSPFVGDYAVNYNGIVYRWSAPEPAPVITSVSPTSGSAGLELTITGEHFTRSLSYGPQPYIHYIGLYESGTDFTDPYNESEVNVWWDWWDNGITVNSDTEIVVTLDQPISWTSSDTFWPDDFYGLHGVVVINNEDVSGFLHNAFTLVEE